LLPIFVELVRKAKEATAAAVRASNTSGGWGEFGAIGAAIQVTDGPVFTGVSISLLCGIGFCAEHSATAEMVKHGYTRIERIVAITHDGTVIPPCGRCRELLYQVNIDNLDAKVLVSDTQEAELRELLPHVWQEKADFLRRSPYHGR
jgi:cytidine deaminase